MDAIMFPQTGKKSQRNGDSLGFLEINFCLHQPQHCGSIEDGAQEEIKMRRQPRVIFKCHKEQMEGFNFPIFAR